MQTTKRIIWPAILIALMFMGLAIVLLIVGFVLFAALHMTKEQGQSLLSSFDSPFNPLFLLFNLIMGLFYFTPFYFALEKTSLFDAIDRSAKVTFKHLRFVAVLVIISTVQLFITSALPKEPSWMLTLPLLISMLVNFFILATSLIYYQKNIKAK